MLHAKVKGSAQSGFLYQSQEVRKPNPVMLVLFYQTGDYPVQARRETNQSPFLRAHQLNLSSLVAAFILLVLKTGHELGHHYLAFGTVVAKQKQPLRILNSLLHFYLRSTPPEIE
mmetsp:Transcript_8783/g.16114  ORF Transcript_8783/g.16114 Transcript_8783/m.16114 type:complete len:115 (+) Transcript_8783:485-829(+)